MTAANHEPTDASELELACDKIRKLLSEADLDDAFARYTVGTIVQRVKEDPSTFGANGVDHLKEALAIGRSSLYRHARVAQRWDEVSFLALLERRTHAGVRLTWRHLELLAEVVEEKLLSSLLETTLATDLSVRQLQRLVMAGRPPRPSAETEANQDAVLQFTNQAAALISCARSLRIDTSQPLDAAVLDRCLESCRAVAEITLELSNRLNRSGTMQRAKVA